MDGPEGMVEDNSQTTDETKGRLVDVILDEKSFARASSDIEHDRAVAIFDLIEDNSFQPVGYPPNRFILHIAVIDNRLAFQVTDTGGKEIVTHVLSLSPLRKIVKDYNLICHSYYDAIRHMTPSQIEAIDMGRRGVHNEGSTILMDRLEGKIKVDIQTARRLFTLVYALYSKA